MISKKQLQEIANKNKIGLYFQEKDYMLNIFLYSLYREIKENKIIFKGGTCLKIVYNYPRFSEDLDFDTDLKPKKIEKIFYKALETFSLLDIEYEIMKKEIFEKSFTAKIRFNGPLYAKRKETANSITIDIGKRGKVFMKPLWKQVNSPYPDIPNYFVLAMQEEEIFAEKARAFLMRKKPRDMFDIWCMLGKGLKSEMVAKKLKEKNVLPKIEFPSKTEYERDLCALLPLLPPYEQVSDEIKISLEKMLKRRAKNG